MKKNSIFTVFVLILTLVFTSCQKKPSRVIKDLFNRTDNLEKARDYSVKANYKDNKTIKIGIASSWEKNITDAHDAIMLALDEVNKNGGVAGAQIELVEGDDDADVNTGTRLAYKMADDKEVFAVIGHAFSDISTPASLIYNYYGIILFNPISSSHMLTRQKDSRIFRNIQDDSEFGIAAAEFCVKKDWKNVAIIYLDVTFGESIANEFELQCGSSNVSVVTRDSFTFRQTESEYRNLFKKWKNNYKFDSILVIGNMPQISQIVNYIREAGLTQPIIGSDSFDDPRMEEMFSQTEAENLYVVSSNNTDSQNPKYKEFVKKFTAAYGHKPDQEGLQWYDAFMVLTSAIDQAGEPSAEKVTQVLRNGTWSEAAGPYTFDSYGNMLGKPLVIKEMTADGYKIVK